MKIHWMNVEELWRMSKWYCLVILMWMSKNCKQSLEILKNNKSNFLEWQMVWKSFWYYQCCYQLPDLIEVVSSDCGYVCFCQWLLLLICFPEHLKSFLLMHENVCVKLPPDWKQFFIEARGLKFCMGPCMTNTYAI